MATAATSSRRFKFLRPFRLRILLALVSVGALLCGWEADRLHRRARAVALLNRWELWVEEEEPAFDGPPWSLLPEWAYLWLLPWGSTCSGVSYLPRVCGTSFPGDPPDPPPKDWDATGNWKARDPTPAERKQLVAAIATLTELPFVQVPFELDDDDLRTLSRLTDMEILGFKTRGLTAAGVASIQKLRKINSLTIDFDGPECVSLEAIAKLGRLPRLEWLSTARLPQGTIARIKVALPHVDVVIEPLTGQKGP
ncbi:MAG TPA: hypothetical protein VHV55_28500 [Pirellulales bacterium]|jgi:hypothetical protein|nr:hypothetical protein [Pirellulales bacterium]